MNITSKETMIFCKEDSYGKTHYKAGLSTKNIKGEYEKGYIDIRLPKDTKLENKTKINITNGFLSFYNYLDKEGKTKTIWYIVVQEFTKEKQEIYTIESFKADELDTPDLPF